MSYIRTLHVMLTLRSISTHEKNLDHYLAERAFRRLMASVEPKAGE